MPKFSKLQQLIRKTFSQYGSIAEDGLYIPVEGDGDNKKTCGYAFIEYESPDHAKEALQHDRQHLDAKHQLRVNLYSDFTKFDNLQTEYKASDRGEFDKNSNLGGWLLDGHGRDQFVLRFARETHIYWNDPVRQAGSMCRALKYGGEAQKVGDKSWTDLYVAWSPQGRYLATFHNQGIMLWGGDNFERLGKFAHPHVKYIDFSPCEKYLVTTNGEDSKHQGDPDCIIIWDIRSGKQLRGFDKGIGFSWPVFKWSHDDRYVARIAEDTKAESKKKKPAQQQQQFDEDGNPIPATPQMPTNLMISVYETPLMGLLDKKSIKVEGISDLQWSPGQNILSYTVMEKENIPARIAMVEIPSRKVVREKHFYTVSDIRMHWQSEGDFLCVKVTRKKTKKQAISTFEIFCMREKDIPVEVKEFQDTIVAFAWEPRGNRFGLIHGEQGKLTASFFQVKRGKLKALSTFSDLRNPNSIFWSSRGGYCVLAGLTNQGSLEFVDCTMGEVLASPDHFQCTDVEWDPSGRYVLTSVQAPIQGGWRYAQEAGYKLWTMQGELLATVPTEMLHQIAWRPRPPSLITKDKEKEVLKNLGKYRAGFVEEDEKEAAKTRSGAREERKAMRIEWREYRAEREKEWEAEAVERAELRGGMESDDEEDYITMEKEFVDEIDRIEELA